MRSASLLSVLVVLAACSSNGGGSPPGVPPEVTLVYLYPSDVTLLAGGRQQFDIQVIGRRLATPAARVSVAGVQGGNDRVGRIDASGLYTAPALPPIPNVVTIEAVSVDDPAMKATARVVVHAPPGTASVSLDPAAIELAHGATLRFTAGVTGTLDGSVTWSATSNDYFRDPVGTIDAAGVYTAPSSGFCHDRITATSVVDPTAQASATVQCIPEEPSIASIFPDRAAAGTSIQVRGAAFYPDAFDDLRVIFPGLDGVPIPVMVPRNLRDRAQIAVQVPFGAISGDVVVECVYPSRTLRSNGIAFTRIPAIRLVPAAVEVAAGTGTRIDAYAVDHRGPLSWSSVQGMTSEGVYSAPSIVAGDVMDTITACIPEQPSACASTHVRVHPFLVTPVRGIVSPGSALALATSGTASPSLEAWGPGAVSRDGSFSPADAPGGSGPIAIHATDSAAAETAWIGVTGVPGEIGRIYGHADPATFATDATLAIALSGNRLYSVVTGDTVGGSTPQNFFIDVYDVTDLTAPTWLGGTEAAFSPQAIWVEGTELFLAAGLGIQNDERRAIAVYDVSADTPVLTHFVRPAEPFLAASHVGTRLSWCSLPEYGATAIPCADQDAHGGARNAYPIPFPPDATTIWMIGSIRTGAYLYLDLTWSDSRSVFTRALRTYDVSSATPALLDVSVLPQPPWFSAAALTPSNGTLLRGPLLFAGASVFDVSGGIPVLQSVLPTAGILDVSGTRAVGLGPAGKELRTFDLADPRRPLLLSAVTTDLPGWPLWTSATLAGDVLAVPMYTGGVVFEQLADPGGLLDRQMTGDSGAVVFDQAVTGSILFMPEIGGGGGELLIADVAAQPPAEIARVGFGSEQPQAIALDGTDLVIGTDRSIRFFDVTTPAAPIARGSFAIPGMALVKSGSWLYASTVRTDGSTALAVIDMTVPAAPVTVNVVGIPAVPIRMVVAGSTLFAAADAAGLLVLDISSPDAPRLQTQWTPAAFVEDVAVEQTTAFLAAGDRGLIVADVAAPDAPFVVAEMPMPALQSAPAVKAMAVALRRGLVYVGTVNDFGRVYAVDPAIREHPRVVGRSRGAGSYADSFVVSFAFSGDDVFYAGWNDDLFGIQEPGTQANDVQARNVVLLHPLELERTIAAADATAPASPLHPKLRAMDGGTISTGRDPPEALQACRAPDGSPRAPTCPLDP